VSFDVAVTELVSYIGGRLEQAIHWATAAAKNIILRSR
jgi:hypothetical protein